MKPTGAEYFERNATSTPNKFVWNRMSQQSTFLIVQPKKNWKRVRTRQKVLMEIKENRLQITSTIQIWEMETINFAENVKNGVKFSRKIVVWKTKSGSFCSEDRSSPGGS